MIMWTIDKIKNKSILKNQAFIRCFNCNYRIPIYKDASIDMFDYSVYCCDNPHYCRE